MKKIYQDNELDQFFQHFKSMPDYYGLERVHQLLDNAPAQTKQTGKTSFNHLNTIIMTITIIGLGLFLYWSPFIQNDEISEKANTSGDEPAVIEKKISEENSIVNSLKELPLKKERLETASNSMQEEQIQPSNPDHVVANSAKKETIANSWPKDSVIDGNALIVNMTNQELEKIGFMLDNTGIYYKNALKGDTVYFHRRSVRRGGEITRVSGFKNSHNKKTAYSNFDFYPVRITKYVAHKIEEGDFASENDLLIPILITADQIKMPKTEYLLWIKPSNQLFKLFPQKFKLHQEIFAKIKAQKAFQPEKNLVVYHKENPSAALIEKLSMIELSQSELSNLGFEINEDKIRFSASSLEIQISSRSISLHTNSLNNPEQKLKSKTALVFLTNKYGEQNIQWKTNSEEADKWEKKYFDNKIQHLVPVLFKTEDYPNLLREDQIFWFEPSEELFSALPLAIGEQLRQEYDLITSASEELKSSSSCTFFEACRSTLQIQRSSLYPNPANGHTSLDFDLFQPIKGRVALVDISGELVKELVPEKYFRQGRNSFTFDLSDIAEGIYVITIFSDQGFKTYRLMVVR